MTDADMKTPHPEDPEQLHPGWQWFLATWPEVWIPGLIAIVSMTFLGVPDEFGLAIFLVALILVLMLGSVVAVYFLGRSFKRGKSTIDRSKNGEDDR